MKIGYVYSWIARRIIHNVLLFLLSNRLYLGNCLWSGCLNFQLKLSLTFEDGFHIGCWNVSCKQQSFSGLQPPIWSFSIKEYYSSVQTIFLFTVLDIAILAFLWVSLFKLTKSLMASVCLLGHYFCNNFLQGLHLEKQYR